jgi:hypothetical protein
MGGQQRIEDIRFPPQIAAGAVDIEQLWPAPGSFIIDANTPYSDKGHDVSLPLLVYTDREEHG